MIDSHAHLYYEKFDEDRDQVVLRAREAGVVRVINIGTDVATSEKSLELAKRYMGFYATVGLHPTTKVVDLLRDIALLETLAKANPDRVVGVGEIGLDYYWKDVAPAAQKESLAAQLDLARRLGLPVVYHCRDALEDLFAFLQQERIQPPGVFHCFSGGPSDAERALALGYHVSFAGNVTYPGAVNLQAALQVVPVEKLLLETDCPFLAPQPVRGKRNEPAHVGHTRDFIAKSKGIDPGELERITEATTVSLFGLS